MFATDDTIVAIATASGRAALGLVRISGPRALETTRAITTRQSALEPRRATLTRLRACGHQDGSARVVDSVMLTYFQAPHSYTGQDVVELTVHGSPVVLRSLIHAAVAAGVRLARPGEFTLRAFLAGRLDLVQAEAVGDLIAAATPLQARVAFDQLEGTLTRRIAALDAELFDLIARLEASLDFPDEGYHFIEAANVRTKLATIVSAIDDLLGDARRGRMIREGATVVIVGRPNVGKSSLFNALSGADRAIVTSVAGTTRDLITEAVDINGIAVTLVDTAGAREARDVVEHEGVARGYRARAVADLLVIILDGSEPLTQDDQVLLDEAAQLDHVLVLNKSDLPTVHHEAGAIAVSALNRSGLEELRCAIARALSGGESDRDSPGLTNVRHIALLNEARASLTRALDAAVASDMPEEFLLTDLQAARMRFDEIVGVRTTDDVLNHIFEKFCIGK